MKIKIDSIMDSEKQLVGVSADAGKLVGHWKGDALTDDKVGSSYCIEIDINTTLKYQRDIFRSDQQRFSASIDGELVNINGIIEDIDEDNVITFRLAVDCLILLEMESTVEISKGMWVKLQVRWDLLSFYPF